jgi:hypothetical protein
MSEGVSEWMSRKRLFKKMMLSDISSFSPIASGEQLEGQRLQPLLHHSCYFYAYYNDITGTCLS